MDEQIEEKEKEIFKKEIQVEWGKIKEILCGIAHSLKLLISILPDGILKKILLGIFSLLDLICTQLPDSPSL